MNEDINAAAAVENEHGEQNDLNGKVASIVTTRNSTPRRRVRPLTSEGEAMKDEIEKLTDLLTLRDQMLDAMRRRVVKWSGFAAFVGFLVGAVLSRAAS